MYVVECVEECCRGSSGVTISLPSTCSLSTYVPVLILYLALNRLSVRESSRTGSRRSGVRQEEGRVKGSRTTKIRAICRLTVLSFSDIFVSPYVPELGPRQSSYWHVNGLGRSRGTTVGIWCLFGLSILTTTLLIHSLTTFDDSYRGPHVSRESLPIGD